MTTSNTFNITRFGLLCRQNAIHYYKLFLTALLGFSGMLFMILLFIQFVEGFRPRSDYFFFNFFIVVFGIAGVVCAGTAFPALRTREMTHNYLMVPASIFEKLVVEFLARVAFFAFVVPLLYWAVYNLEGYVVNIFSPSFGFRGQVWSVPEFRFQTAHANRSLAVLMLSGGMLIFITSFLGAVVFTKAPLIKTLFAVAIIFFFNLFVVYFFLETLGLNQFYPANAILFMANMEDAILGSVLATLIFNVGFIVAAYFKLKEREA